jgi:hypothetical protein
LALFGFSGAITNLLSRRLSVTVVSLGRGRRNYSSVLPEFVGSSVDQNVDISRCDNSSNNQFVSAQIRYACPDLLSIETI